MVLYFYLKDNIFGCIIEGLDFRDYYEDFKKVKILIFGVFKDIFKFYE